MAQKTGKIKYNLKDRGYRHHGKPRNFNIPRVAQMINSPATQERIAGRAMVGFYGHWPRVKWGAVAAEGGVDENGKQIVVEPAFVTTHLEALPDGTIIHEEEFLDNEPGQACLRLHKSRTGGFSSVIDEVAGYMGGFDYVIDPNYRDNRGYTLDSATGHMIYDDANGANVTIEMLDSLIAAEQMHGMKLVLDAADYAVAQRDALLQKLTEENEELLSMLAKSNPQAAAIFDAAHMAGSTGTTILDTGAAQDLLRASQEFMHADLGQVDNTEHRDRKAEQDNLHGRMTNFFNRLIMG